MSVWTSLCTPQRRERGKKNSVGRMGIVEYFYLQHCEIFKKNEMGRACSTFGRCAVHTGFWWGNLLVRDYLVDPGLDGRIILKRALKKWNGGCGLDWSVSG